MIMLAGLSLVLRMSCGTPWRKKQVRSRLGGHRVALALPLAFALKHVEGFFLNTMHVQAGGKSRRQGPVKHRRVFCVLAGHQERQRLVAPRDIPTPPRLS